MHNTELTGDSKPLLKPKKGWKGIGMEGVIARYYDKNSRKTPEQYKSWAQRVAENFAQGNEVLEVAPGPGYLAILLAQLGKYNIVGLDISRTFVEIAQKNATEAGVEDAIVFRQGDAAHMPFDDETFDFIVCTSAFKNFTDPLGALREMYRVLKENRTALIIDMRRDVSDKVLNDAVKSMGVSRINSLIMRWTFKYMLKRRAYTKNQFKDFISKTQFRRYDIRGSEDLSPETKINLIGFEIWLKK